MLRKCLLSFVALGSLGACDLPGSLGAPCGGGQYADARAVLPDTGINAKDTLSVIFLQHDTQELTELVVWHLWPRGNSVSDPAPDPRVRIVTSDGRVLLDSVGTRYNQPENRYNRPTWYVSTWIRDAGLRNSLFDGFRDQSLWVELWRVGATAPGTRVRLQTEHVEVHPVLTCL